MAEPSTVARPYAEAAFKLADQAGALARWPEMLSALAMVGVDERVRAAAADPNLGHVQVVGTFIAVLAVRLRAEAENFELVLELNERLELLHEISAHFEPLKNQRE